MWFHPGADGLSGYKKLFLERPCLAARSKCYETIGYEWTFVNLLNGITLNEE